MGEDGFSIEEAYRVVSKNGPIETYKRDLNKVGTGKFWMYTEEYFYPRQCKLTPYLILSLMTHILVYIVKANYDNETKPSEANIQYLVVTDASRMGLMVYARDPMTFYQVSHFQNSQRYPKFI
jgi:hypothetical protein